MSPARNLGPKLHPFVATYPFGELGARLRAARLFGSVSLHDAARACQVEPWQYLALERGKERVTRNQLVALEAVLGIDGQWVRTGRTPTARLIDLDDETLVAIFDAEAIATKPQADLAEDIRKALRARLLVGEDGDFTDLMGAPADVLLVDRVEAAGRWIAKGALFAFVTTFFVLLMLIIATGMRHDGRSALLMGFVAASLGVWAALGGLGMIVSTLFQTRDRTAL